MNEHGVPDNHSAADADSVLALALKSEALLFTFGALTKKELATHLGVSAEECARALVGLRTNRTESGIVLVDDGTTVELRAAPSAAPLIEAVYKEEYARDIGKAGLEVLAAVLYRGVQTRAQIDFIRGVNSSQTLRTLTMRGLLRKVVNPKNERSFLFEPTVELFAHLGITSHEQLPEYEEVRAQLAALESRAHGLAEVSAPALDDAPAEHKQDEI